jgi:hypothetical protein
MYVGLSVCLMHGVLVCGADAGERNTMRVEMTFWKTIEALAEQIPFAKQRVEALLHTTLRETDNAGNDVFQFYESPPIELADGVVISNVDLRIKRTGEHPGFMVLEIGGQCVTLEKIRLRYGNVRMTDSPRGNFQYAKVHYTANLPWGSLSFGFLERSPDCLASVALSPGK